VIGTASAGSTSDSRITATARWEAPATDGGSVITGYQVTALRLNSTGAVVQTVVSGIRPATARSLWMVLPRTGQYAFTVNAINALGPGAPSARSATVAGR
jgi:hypothetical protein